MQIIKKKPCHLTAGGRNLASGTAAFARILLRFRLLGHRVQGMGVELVKKKEPKNYPHQIPQGSLVAANPTSDLVLLDGGEP